MLPPGHTCPIVADTNGFYAPLDALLKEADLQRQGTPQDGDAFFYALAMSMMGTRAAGDVTLGVSCRRLLGTCISGWWPCMHAMPCQGAISKMVEGLLMAGPCTFPRWKPCPVSSIWALPVMCALDVHVACLSSTPCLFPFLTPHPTDRPLAVLLAIESAMHTCPCPIFPLTNSVP